MLTVEDGLAGLHDLTSAGSLDPMGAWDVKFIEDVWRHSSGGNAISTAQSAVVLKLVEKYREALIQRGAQSVEISQLLLTPSHRSTPYESPVVNREVRALWPNKLVFRCKFNAQVVEDLKRLKSGDIFSTTHYPSYQRDHRLWIVKVTEHNCHRVMDLIGQHSFHFNDSVLHMITEVSNSKNQRSRVVTLDDHLALDANDDFLSNWADTLTHMMASK